MAAVAGLKPLVGSTLVACKATGGSCSVEIGSVSLPQLGGSRRVVRSGVRAGRGVVVCSAGDVSVSQSQGEAEAGTSQGSGNWVPVIPLNALPRGERRLVRQDGETVLLLWYKNDVYAIENQSPAEGAYSEGLINARLTPDGCIVCPSTESTYDLKTGKVRDWMPANPVLRVLTPSLRDLVTYPVKVDNDSILINVQGAGEAEIVFGGAATGQAGRTATNVDVDEVRMVVDDTEEGFGWTRKNEIINGRAAMAGFFMLLIQELLTGKGFLGGLGFLDFVYRVSGYHP
ncbi:hypothetical protein KC19_5G156500 [Ceratodon purpureus]|uniref:Rieske domain-containing protein n=1 Tax=Ceratodon purpureus TaxID=3225 RepID=A0A8T0I1W9_CERPU|nr:hypothetical protein KC19_5G156500 [Ceratodon purpureus]